MGLAYQGRQYRHFIATYRPGQFESLTQRHMFVNRGFVLHRRIYSIVVSAATYSLLSILSKRPA
jgi:hypothetical protein